VREGVSGAGLLYTVYYIGAAYSAAATIYACGVVSFLERSIKSNVYGNEEERTVTLR
jgi:hypothetical protein